MSIFNSSSFACSDFLGSFGQGGLVRYYVSGRRARDVLGHVERYEKIKMAGIAGVAYRRFQNSKKEKLKASKEVF